MARKVVPMVNRNDLLVVLMEEATEVAHAASKVIRFGPKTDYPGKGMTNEQHLALELNELQAVADMVRGFGVDLFVGDSVTKRYEKMNKVMRHMKLKPNDLEGFPVPDDKGEVGRGCD